MASTLPGTEGVRMDEAVLHLHSVSFERGEEIWPEAKPDYKKFEAGFKRLARRALLMAGVDDVVIIDKPVDPSYISLLRDAGAGGAEHKVPSCKDGSSLAEDVVNSPELVDFIKLWKGPTEIYIPGPAEEKLSRLTGVKMSKCTAAVATLLNDKIFFTRMLEDIGVPQIKTYIANSDAISARLENKVDEPVVLRGGRSVGGSRVWVARNKGERAAVIKDMNKAGREMLYLLQPLLEVKHSPNMQFYITDDEAVLFGETTQSLTSEMEHTGNLFDRCQVPAIRGELMEQGKTLALEAASLGYRGVVGVDFVVTNNDEVFAVEMNARHNTSTDAIWFVNRLLNGDPMIEAPSGIAAFMTAPSNKNLRAMQWLKMLGDDAFDTAKGTGVLPYDTEGFELAAVIVGKDEEDRGRLMEKARTVAGC